MEPIKRSSILLVVSGALLAGISGCLTDSDTGSRASLSELARARELWQKARPAAYGYRLARSCFCPPEFVGPFLVEAQGDSVTQVRRARSAGDTVDVSESLQDYSMTALFQEVEALLAEENDFEKVEYHATYGFPALVSVDREAQGADDEMGYRITDFKAR